MADNVIKTTVVLDATKAQQDIVKFNAKASDSTKSLAERVEAKNKQVEIQEKLSKQTLKDLEDEIDKLSKLEGNTGTVIRLKKKLNSERIKATKLSENNAKAQSKLSGALEDSKKATKRLDDATGGLLGKMKAFVANPIGIVVIAIAAAFKLMSGAVSRSSKASSTFAKIGAKLSGIFNGILAVLEPLVEFIGDKLLAALNNPKKAILDLGNSIKQNLINRLKSFLVLGEAFAELMKGNFKKAAKVGADALIQFTTGVENGTNKIKEFGDEAVKNFNKAAKATNSLADAEKRLARLRISAEKQQLKSLTLAEKERQIRDDTSRNIDERIEANKRLGQVLSEQLTIEQNLAKQVLGMANARMSATGNTIENIEAVGDAEIKLLEIQERITGQRSEQLVNEIGLIKEKKDLSDKIAADEKAAEDKKKEEAAAQKEIDDEAAKVEEEKRLEKILADQEAQNELDQLEIERLTAQGERTLDLELALLERKRTQDVSAADLSAKQIQLINEQAAVAKERVNAIAIRADKAKEKAVLENALDGAAQAFGIAQEVAVAKMIMAAPEGIANSFKMAAASYAPPLSLAMGALGAAGIVVPIVKGLADIKKTRFSKSKKGAATNTGASISTSSISSVSSGVSTSSITDLSESNSARLGLDTSLSSRASASAANNVLGESSQGIVFSESRYLDFKNQVTFKEEKSTI